MNQYHFISIDPRMRQVVTYTWSKGREVTDEAYNHSKYFQTVMDRSQSISNETYQEMMGTNINHQYEINASKTS